MRIIAGSARGRRLRSPESGTRPMTGRARESVFAILGTRLEGASVLDLYAGSGSLGLEALSRGASTVVFVERSSSAVDILRTNIEAVGLGGSVVASDVVRALPRVGTAFDVVFVDPPYADPDGAVASVLEGVGDVLAPNGIIVLHRRAGSEPVIPEFLTCVDERQYGDAVVSMFERTEP